MPYSLYNSSAYPATTSASPDGSCGRLSSSALSSILQQGTLPTSTGASSATNPSPDSADPTRSTPNVKRGGFNINVRGGWGAGRCGRGVSVVIFGMMLSCDLH